MGQLVFQATLGGQVNLVGPNTASTFNINVPAVAGNMVTTGDTGTVTNTMLAGSIANAKLTNSSVTVGSTSIALGATSTTLAGLTSVGSNLLTSAAATALTLQSAGTTAVTIDTSQNVGIGVTPSSWTLYDRVFQLGSSSSFYTYQQTELNISTNQYYNAGSKYLGTGASARYQQSAGAHVWYYAGSGTAGNAISYSESMRIDSSGNVGIGKSNPTAKLQVSDGTTTLDLNPTGGVVYFGTSTNHPMIFNTNNTERMRIDTSGNLQLGYGGASPTAVTAPQGLSLASPANTALQIYLFKLSQVEAHIGFKSSTDTNFYVGTSGGGGPGGIGAYGLYQTNTSTSWTAVSDERFKTELQPIENALDKISNVRAVTGRYSYDEENGVTKRRPFLIAQDWLTALPEAVDQQNSEKLGLSYSDTVPLLVAAIKELKAINDQQAETINALTARVVALEAK